MAAKTLKIKYLSDGVKVMTLTPDAHYPEKEEGRESDAGYDITLTGRTENRAEDVTHDVNYFTTGLKITPPAGYHCEIVARSSLHKHGYMLATGTSIIDPGYTGEIIIPLYKFKEAEDLATPCKAVQLLIRPTVYAYMRSVGGLPPSERGEGRFGSSGGYLSPPYNDSEQNMSKMSVSTGAKGGMNRPSGNHFF